MSQDQVTAPAAAPPVPTVPRAGRQGGFRRWRARLIVLILVAAAVLLFVKINRDRVADATHIDLATVTLTAQAIPVETPRPGQVMSVSVTAQQQVKAGQKLGTVQVTTTDSDGEPVLSTLTLTAPRAGVVVDEPVTMGSTLQPGQPFVKLYDPAKLTFTTDVPLRTLTRIAPGMVATLRAEGLDERVKAVVQRIVPRVGDDTSEVAPGDLRMVLVPAAGQDTRPLIPGLRLTGSVDTLTGPPGSPRLISVS